MMEPVGKKAGESIVLSYHGVGRVDDRDDPNRLVTSPEHLVSHIRLFQRRGYRFIRAEQLPQDTPPDEPTVVFTFDDGWRDALTTTAPMLRRFGVPGTFFVNPQLWERQHTDVRGPAGALLSAEETKRVHDLGMEIGSHSLAHHDLRTLSASELERDLRRSKEMIEEAIEAPCTTLAYPFGLFGEREMGTAESVGYSLAFAWGLGAWRRFAIPRMPAPPRHGALRLALKQMGIRRPVRLG